MPESPSGKRREPTGPAGPVASRDRIVSLDVLRGFAVLGILVMNIQSFAAPSAAYTNPTAYGDLTGANLVTWVASHLLVDQKFMTLFSLLFGAGVLLFAERAEARRGRSAAPHYRRMFWLLLIGLAHAYLLWSGDVLVTYAVCGCLVFPLRNRAPKTLAVAGLAVLSVASLLSVGLGLLAPLLPEAETAEIAAVWAPGAAEIEAQLAAYRGGWLAQQGQRVPDTVMMHTTVIPALLFWRVAGVMLLGMALHRWRVLDARRNDRFNRRLALVGFGLGAPAVAAGIGWNFAGGWSWERSFFLGTEFNYWGSLAMALGYIGLAMLAIRRRWLPALQARLAAAGRMAFTNYIAQTLLCTTIFYGHGFGLFGHVERWQMVPIVLAVWALQLWWSPLVLARFRHGPLEWAWRALTYGQLLPGGGTGPSGASAGSGPT